MVGDHLTQEVSVDVVVRAGVSHPEKHILRNLMKALQILVLRRFCILQEIAAVQGVRHICDAFRLFCNDIFCDLLQGKPGGVPEKVFRHFDGRPVVGDHLDDEIVGNAVCQSGFCHAGDHRIEDLPVAGDIPAGYMAEFWVSVHFENHFSVFYSL